jgi:general secretion pathway protein D
MKKIATLSGVLALTLAALAQPVPQPTPQPAAQPVVQPAAQSGKDEAETIVIPAGHTMQGIPLETLLEEYGTLVGRTLIMAQNLPKVTFDFKTNNDLTYQEAQAFYETLLSQRQIAAIPLGEKFVMIIPVAEVTKTPPKFTTMSGDELPEGQIYIIKTVQLEYALPSELADVLNSYSKSPNAVQSIDSTKTLVLRDFSSNVKRMLELIELVDVEEKFEEEYEIVRIKYALSDDIMAVLGNLTIGGSATVGISGTSTSGSRTTPGRTSGSSGLSGGSTGSRISPRSTGSSSRGSSRPTSGSSSSRGSLQNRLNTITRGATTSGTGLPILGDVRIISNPRNNEVLIFGKRRFLDRAVDMIAKLDTIQKQVLIESMIIDVALGDDMTFGTSIRAQMQEPPGGNAPNGGLSAAFASALGPAAFTPTTIQDAATGFNYFAQLGNNWELAVNAIKNDSRVSMLSRPRIQTTHARSASLFIGERRPVVTGTITDISGGTSSTYQLQQIGITLEITPFINDDGLVVMDIYQQIQDIIGTQTINGNPVPITTDREADAKVAVRDGEMIVLGGFIKSKTTSTKSGVPILRDIPLLGRLFETSYDSDERSELIVLLRPTVLDTPEAAHAKALELQGGLPGIDGAKHNEIYLEEKFRHLLEIKKRQRESEMRKFRKSAGDENDGNPNRRLIPPLPKND